MADQLLGTDAGATFDYGGGKVATAWVGPQDGILVRDANHDGQVSADEIVFATDGSDLQGLAVYDSNGDGQLSAADSAFAEFGVWQDADSDGQVDAGELQSLTAEGIASISLSSDGVGYSAAGGDVSVVGTGSFTRTDGSTGVLADAVFATGGRVAEAELRTASSRPTVTSSPLRSRPWVLPPLQRRRMNLASKAAMVSKAGRNPSRHRLSLPIKSRMARPDRSSWKPWPAAKAKLQRRLLPTPAHLLRLTPTIRSPDRKRTDPLS